jgi:hypothetical protein
VPARADEAITLAAQPRPGVPETVSVDIAFGGDLEVPSDASSSTSLPVAATAKIVYDEVRLPESAARSVRYYRTAQAESEVAENAKSPSLRQSRRLVVVQLESHHKRLHAVDGPLLRSEYDLLDTAADSLVLDCLVPGREVPLGGTWSHTSGTMQAFTGLDSVGLCEVSSVLAEANERFARCQMAGVVHGVVHGASAELEIDAVYLYDRQARRVTQLNVAIRENRQPGPATPGVNAVAKLRVKVAPADESPLTPQRVAEARRQPLDEAQVVETRNDRLGFATTHDESWYTTGTRGSQTTLRRVASEGLVAHANITNLPAKPLDPKTALDDFRGDVLRSLGKDGFGVASEEQWVNKHGCRVMAVVVAGQVKDTDVEWHAFQVAPPAESQHLHRLALTFTVEKSELERLGKSDRDLVDRIELLQPAALEAKRSATRK